MGCPPIILAGGCASGCINGGTVFYFGYDDDYRQADQLGGDRNGDGIDEQLFFASELRRTNRAIFTKPR